MNKIRMQPLTLVSSPPRRELANVHHLFATATVTFEEPPEVPKESPPMHVMVTNLGRATVRLFTEPLIHFGLGIFFGGMATLREADRIRDAMTGQPQ